MFQDGAIEGVICKPLKRFEDARGWLLELFREDELSGENRPAMTYLSMTLPGVVRGPHEHRDQTDYFAFVGPGDFKLYLWDSRSGSPSYGHRQVLVVGQSNFVAVIVPPGVVHAYQSMSPGGGIVFNAPNRLYAGRGRREAVDEIRHENKADSPYQIE